MPQFQAHQDYSLEARVARDRFQSRYKTSVEHCLRLLIERLQLNLDKRDGVDLTDANTWLMSPADIQHLAESLALLDQINRLNNAK
jgi:hypothetical protein